MTRPSWIWVLLLLAGATTAEAAERLLVRLSLDPTDPWVGQSVTLNLDVLGLDSWANVPKLPNFEIDGAYLLRVQTQGARLNETIDGESYSGQRYRWLLFPQREGDITVPSTPVDVNLKVFGAGSDDEALAAETPATTLAAKLPPGVTDPATLVTTRNFDAGQVFEPDTPSLNAGDGIRRTVTRTAAGVAGMALPPLNIPEIDGLSIYVDEPEVGDRINRGRLEQGTRVERITYVPTRGGEFQLPPLSFSWWNPETEVLEEETLDGPSISVSAPPVATTDGAPEAAREPKHRAAWYLLAVLSLVAALAGYYRDLFRQAWRRRQQERRDGEATRFRRFETAVRASRNAEAVNELMGWLQRIGYSRLDDFLARHGVPESAPAAEALLRAGLNHDNRQVPGVVDALTAARRDFLATGRRTANAGRLALDPLNP